MKKTLIFYVFIFNMSIAKGFSQDLPPIQTDRPDQTECPFIVPKHYLQVENGLPFEITNACSTQNFLPTILVRYGINDHFEIRLVTEYHIENSEKGNFSDFNPVLIGFKTQFLKEKGWIPTTSFIGHISVLNSPSQNLNTRIHAPEFRFTMQHTLSNKQSLSYNIGAEWNGETAEPTYIYTLTTGYSFTEKLSSYIECYGFVPQIEKPDHRFDFGFVYLLTPNHQFDMSSGIGLSKNSPNYFVSFGYSFRFKM